MLDRVTRFCYTVLINVHFLGYLLHVLNKMSRRLSLRLRVKIVFKNTTTVQYFEQQKET